MKNNVIKISEKDNVAVALTPILKGSSVIVDGQTLFSATEDIQPGHKIALVPITTGDNVLRYGEAIVEAIRPIGQGEWVHVHNTRPIP